MWVAWKHRTRLRVAGGVGAGDYILAERDLFEISQDAGASAIIVYLLTLLPGDLCDYIRAGLLHYADHK
jgi:hypothetical protein